MPDLNLGSEQVREEFSDIVQFWFDRGVDGFRLDAVKEYYTGADAKNIETLEWFTGMVKEKKEDAYLVGEAWTDYNTYTKYYRSGIDSLFDFSFAENDGYIAKVLNGTTKSRASTYGKAIEAVQALITENNPNGIDAPFYTNHDTGRSAGYYSGDNAENKVKMAQAMNLLMSGNAFLYYGEELGMKGSGKDENKRVGMYWSKDENEEGMCDGPADADAVEMIYGSLAEQQDDPYSIYEFVKQTIKLRNVYPEIARGTVTFEEALSGEELCVLKKEYNGSELLLVFNLSANANTLDLSGVSLNGKASGDLELAGVLQTTEEAPALDGSVVNMPQFSVFIAK
jgi:glycosidase